jgi:hypothetical protein
MFIGLVGLIILLYQWKSRLLRPLLKWRSQGEMVSSRPQRVRKPPDFFQAGVTKLKS